MKVKLLSLWLCVSMKFSVTRFFYKRHFYKQRQPEIDKNQEKAKQHPEAELLLFENFLLSSSTSSSKNYRRYSKKCTKEMYSWVPNKRPLLLLFFFKKFSNLPLLSGTPRVLIFLLCESNS